MLLNALRKLVSRGPKPTRADAPDRQKELVLRDRIAAFDDDTQSVWGLWYDLRHLARLRIDANDTAEALELLFRADKIRHAENALAPEKKSALSRSARVKSWARYQADLDLASDLIRTGAVDAGARLFVQTAEGRAWEEPIADAFGHLLALVIFLRSTPEGYLEADIAAQAALAFAEARHPPPHVDRLHALSSLLYTLRLRRRKETEILPLRERLVTESEAVYGPHAPPVAAALSSLASSCHETGEYERAVDLRRRVLAIEERIHGPTSWRVTAARSQLSHALESYGLIDEALVEAERAYESIKSVHEDKIVRSYGRRVDDLRARKGPSLQNLIT